MAEPVQDEHENTKKWVLGVLIVIAVLIVGIFIGRAIEDSENQDDKEQAQQQFAETVTQAQIEDLQTCLANGGYYTGDIDGTYGTETTEAVEEFQKDYGLTADGVVGHATQAQMDATGCAMPVGPPTSTTTTGGPTTTGAPTSTTTTTA